MVAKETPCPRPVASEGDQKTFCNGAILELDVVSFHLALSGFIRLECFVGLSPHLRAGYGHVRAAGSSINANLLTTFPFSMCSSIISGTSSGWTWP